MHPLGLAGPVDQPAAGVVPGENAASEVGDALGAVLLQRGADAGGQPRAADAGGAVDDDVAPAHEVAEPHQEGVGADVGVDLDSAGNAADAKFIGRARVEQQHLGGVPITASNCSGVTWVIAP